MSETAHDTQDERFTVRVWQVVQRFADSEHEVVTRMGGHPTVGQAHELARRGLNRVARGPALPVNEKVAGNREQPRPVAAAQIGKASAS